MNLALYCKQFPCSLYSLGWLHRCGGSYHSDHSKLQLIVKANSDTVINVSRLSPTSNLSPIDAKQLNQAIKDHPHLSEPIPYANQHRRSLLPQLQQFLQQLNTTNYALAAHLIVTKPPSPSPALHPLIAQPSASPRTTLRLTCPPTTTRDSPHLAAQPPYNPLTAPPLPTPTPNQQTDITLPHTEPTTDQPTPIKQLSAEQRRRIQHAIDLHQQQAHPPDDQLCTELSTGKHPYSNLVASDIRLMRAHSGPCPHCLAARSHQPDLHRSTSHSPPATQPGEVISFDPQLITHPVIDGYTQKIIMVDEFTGHISQPGTVKKTTQAIADAMTKTIATVFNANSHRTRLLHGDAESVNTSLKPPMGKIGIKVGTSIPGDHAQRAERSTQTIQQRSRSIIDHLPYYLPPELELLLQQSVGETLNNSICKASTPSTPNELVYGFKPHRQPIPFGRCAMVTVSNDRKLKFSHESKLSFKLAPITELGVSMGLYPGTDHTKFLLANGSVLLRRPIGDLMPNSFIPFGWKPKPTIYSTPVCLTPQPEPPTAPTNQTNPNVEIQQPTPQLDATTSTHSITVTTEPPLITTPPNNSQSPDAHQQRNPPSQDTTTPTPTAAHQQLPHPTKPPNLRPDSIPTSPAPATPPTTIPPQPTLTHSNQPPTGNKRRSVPPLPADRQTRRSSTRTFLTTTSTLQPYTFVAAPDAHKSGHQLRKQANATAAAIRDRTHRETHPPPRNLNNRTTDLRPIPPTRQQNEFTVNKALRVLDPDKVNAALNKELDKVFVKYKSLRLITPQEIEHNAVHIRTQVIIKEKTNKDITARMALDGGAQPPETYGDTYAGTSDASHRMFVLATAIADAAHRGIPLYTFSYDIPGAFLNGNTLTREHTGGRQLVAHMPSSLPAPYNSATAEVLGAHYGLKQSNNIYDEGLINLHTSNGFSRMPSSPYTFQTKHSHNPATTLTVSMHVDDAEGNTTSLAALENYKKLITDRYGQDVIFNVPSKGICAQVIKTNTDGSTTLHCGPYIEKLLRRIGMDKVPAALSPEVEGLFDASTDTTPLSPSATAEYKTVNGELIHILTTRFDIKKQVCHLLTRNETPDNSDYLKQFHVLRYLKATSEFGPTFSNDAADYPNGVEIHSASDCAHNVHTGGQSHGAYTLTVGKVGANTAPFLHYSAKEKGVSLSPTEGEYTILSKTAKVLIHYRQFATDLGYPQPSPSIMLEDNNSAIKLVTTPLIPAKSRHIDLKFHHIRWAHKTNQILPQHQGTQDIVPDAATKHVGPSRFLFFRHQIFKGPPLKYSNNI